MPIFPNSRVHTAPIFAHPVVFYNVLEAGEAYFQTPDHKDHVPKPEDCTTARDLGLKIDSTCVVRGPHVVHGYDDTVHGTVVDFQTCNGYDIVVVRIPPRSAQKNQEPSTSHVERRFLMQWDEVGTEDVEMKIMTGRFLLSMLFVRVRLVPLLTRVVHKEDGNVTDRVVWFPAIFDTTGEKRDSEEHLALSFVHITPQRCLGRAPPDTLPLFSTSIAWAHRGSVRRYAAAQGQLLAADVCQTHFFRAPPLAAIAAMLRSPQNLPLEPPGAEPGRTPVGPHRRLGRALERVRSEGTGALAEVFEAAFVYSCPCLPSTPDAVERHCVCHSLG
ncbi:hypothetical protein PsYK624_063180 [Phanerochaete sordida]|uniref:Uncharacterized protein n=1 Tax=Phanerochaete sordida TaxID=48140 RepID=A0A9P3LDQ9_9APHY|nr:hypothetical protein PsYK624_063180 [Phanerochaete sordida]